MDLIGFALAVLVIELTPGPNMAWLAGLAATEGRRSGLAAVWGVGLGLLANGLLAALGLAALLAAAPWVWSALQLAGAGMMAVLAVLTWREAGQPAAAARRAGSVWRSFTAGTMINLLNPKAYLFFVVVAPRFLSGGSMDLRAAVALTLVSAGIATIVHLAIVLAGAKAHDWLQDPARARLARRGFAVLMLGVAISFLVTDVQSAG
ncbi:LysE family translocator [Sandarakinorhabdus sp.]|uniref:LysE family translocator n=1 Tax=Sandarakinorhabdus sp. TaxID=1916663 RepID=UPI003F7048E2